MTQNSNLKEFHYDLVIMAEDQRQADRVVSERTGYDEDLRENGVGDYQISASTLDGREMDPVDPEEDGPDPGDNDRLAPAISTEGPVTSINGEQYKSILRINAALGGAYRFPEARSVYVGNGQSVIELAFQDTYGRLHVRLDENGALHGADLQSQGEKTVLEDGAIHALLVEAVAHSEHGAGEPTVNSNWTLSGATEDQRYSFARINTILGGGPLPTASAAGDSKEPLLELNYPHDGEEPVRIRLSTDGSLYSMQTKSGDDWIDMEGGALHALVTKALNVTVVG